MTYWRSIGCFLISLCVAVSVSGQDGLKIYISADMEGVVGAVTGDQLGPSGFEYGKFRELMTAEVNVAIEAARQAGATEILVSDSHGNGQNLLLDKLPQDIRLVRSWPRPLMMMEGIDETFDDFKPYRLDGPIDLEVSFKNYRPPQLLSYLPTVELVDSHTIRYVGEDMVAVSKFLEVLTSYEVSLTP